MPKLTQETSEKVDAVKDGFEPVPEGVYILQLVADVDVREGNKGPYWRWAFEIPKTHKDADGVEQELEYAGRKFWTNTSLSESAFFKLKETFGAFGAPTNTDTEDLVGKRVKAVIIIKAIEGGQRKGELSNEIDKLVPLDYDENAAEGRAAADAKTGDSSEPLF